MRFKTNDILINYRRSTIYKYNETNEGHKKDIGNCRFATFKEIEKYKAANKEVCKLHEIGINRREVLKKISISFEVDKSLLSMIHRFCRDNKINNYKSFVWQLFRELNEKPERIETEKTKQINKLREALKEVLQFINE